MKREIRSVGLRIDKFGGVFLKPFSNLQMEKLLDEKGIIAFNKIGSRYPEIASEMYFVCSLPEKINKN